jgi:hypothetical protein
MIYRFGLAILLLHIGVRLAFGLITHPLIDVVPLWPFLVGCALLGWVLARATARWPKLMLFYSFAFLTQLGCYFLDACRLLNDAWGGCCSLYISQARVLGCSFFAAALLLTTLLQSRPEISDSSVHPGLNPVQ